MKADAQHELQLIVAKRELSALFQPIFSVNPAKLLGFEALIRGPSNSMFHNPNNLFEAARRSDQLVELEYACREVSCSAYQRLQLPGKLFLNVSPTLMFAEGYKSGVMQHLLKNLNFSAEQIVMEISEQYPFEDYEKVHVAMSYYRKLGLHIALDDLGVGYSGLKAWSEIRPNYVKLDRHFISGVDINDTKKEFVRSVVEMSDRLGCHVIAEGIETENELDTIRKLGVGSVQGFFLGRPKRLPDVTVPIALQREIQFDTSPIRRYRSPTAEVMLETISPLIKSRSTEDVADLFHQNSGLLSLPVIDGEVPVGIITRQRITELFSGRYFRELNGRKPIERFMSRDITIVDADEPLESVSRKVTQDPEQDLSKDFIITKNNQYKGIGKVRSLLKRITELELRTARYSNPLTQMPGNVPIDEMIDDLLAAKIDFHVAYFDINNFKPFNDVYGYSLGDEVIITLGQVLQTGCSREKDMAGHVGGDDFVVIFQSDDWRNRCRSMMDQFNSRVLMHYNEEDRKNHGIYAENRKGEQEFYELLTVSAGVVHPDSNRCSSYHEVSSLAAEAKKQAKRAKTSDLFISRRRGPQKDG